MRNHLSRDPYNVIIAGVGGQGNVTASRILGNMLAERYVVTTGETFGVSQRGGVVMSHLRISADTVWSPQIPEGKADLVIALEPAEAVRVMSTYGNSESRVIVNIRPVYPAGVLTGELKYPSVETIKKTILELTDYAWFLNATDIVLRSLGNSLLQNVVMLGALTGLNVLPIDKNDFIQVVSKHLSKDKVIVNIKAFEIGARIVAPE
jgi:indolepyruvate ferredoxin oxidoreductase beta subunit